MELDLNHVLGAAAGTALVQFLFALDVKRHLRRVYLWQHALGRFVGFAPPPPAPHLREKA